MKFYLWYIFVFCSIVLHSQTKEELSVLTKTDWQINKSRFGNDTIKLSPRKKLDTIGLTASQKKELIDVNFYGERISFNLNGEIFYYQYMDCPVGETLIRFKEFVFSENRIKMHYDLYPWHQAPKSFGPIYYNITKLTERQIILTKSK